MDITHIKQLLARLGVAGTAVALLLASGCSKSRAVPDMTPTGICAELTKEGVATDCKPCVEFACQTVCKECTQFSIQYAGADAYSATVASFTSQEQLEKEIEAQKVANEQMLDLIMNNKLNYGMSRERVESLSLQRFYKSRRHLILATLTAGAKSKDAVDKADAVRRLVEAP